MRVGPKKKKTKGEKARKKEGGRKERGDKRIEGDTLDRVQETKKGKGQKNEG